MLSLSLLLLSGLDVEGSGGSGCVFHFSVEASTYLVCLGSARIVGGWCWSLVVPFPFLLSFLVFVVLWGLVESVVYFLLVAKWCRLGGFQGQCQCRIVVVDL